MVCLDSCSSRILTAPSFLAAGTLSRHDVMEGFLDLKMPPWDHRMLPRLVAIVPAVVVAAVAKDSGVVKLLLLKLS
jgi:Mn2+/Fe2+ NRAMP family transporter